MTLPKVARVFFAVDLPDTTKEIIGKFTNSLKKKSKSHAIRWTRPENLHITLQFLAHINIEHIPQLIANVQNEIKDVIKKSSFSFGKITLFPNPYRPRVIVLEVDRQEELTKLAEVIGHGITKTEYPVEKRPFRAHLTLGRIKQPHGIHLEFLSEAKMPEFAEILLAEVILFRSEPEIHGSKYTVLEKISF